MKTAYKTPKIRVVELLAPICQTPLAGSVTIPDYDDEGEWPDEESLVKY